MDRMRTAIPTTIAAAAILTVSASPGERPPDELVRLGNLAYHSGDVSTAGRLYESAAVRTTDPGLVAFNTAAVRFADGDYRAAEVHYLQALSDPAIPPGRRAEAEYNRGVCLLRRGGSADVYRAAIAAFEAALAVPGADAGLAADARHNLELAKLLWADARRDVADPPDANAPSPEPSSPPPVRTSARTMTRHPAPTRAPRPATRPRRATPPPAATRA